MAELLSTDPEADFHRSISGNKRILEGLGQWDVSWLTTSGVVAYERAHGRITNERPQSRGLAGAWIPQIPTDMWYAIIEHLGRTGWANEGRDALAISMP